jgi:transcriptional regulator with XRE-family HTH domain
MPQVSGPLGPRRRIATTLKRWRDESGKSLTEVFDVTLISTSKLSRLENAEGKPRLRDVRDLIRFYGREETPQAGQLERWVKAAEATGWWTDFGDDILVNRLRLDTHLAYEADAATERVYTLPFVPVLLQTDAYAEAVYRDMEHRSEDQIGKLMDIRRKRKEALRRRDGLAPLRLVAVTHECTLRQTVGSPQILRDQLDELLVRSHEENVSLYVFPFSAKPVFTMVCMYAYFEYEDRDDLEQDIVQIETQAGFWTIEDTARVTEYRKSHDSLVAASLKKDESRALIRNIRDTLPPSLAALSPLRHFSWGYTLVAIKKRPNITPFWPGSRGRGARVFSALRPACDPQAGFPPSQART